MKKLFSFFIVAAFSFAAYSCSKDSSIVNPVPTIKTPFEMSWTADTLSATDPSGFQMIMDRLCGFAPNDIWTVGWGDPPTSSIWHYDGKSWKVNALGPSNGMNPFDIEGNSSNDIWVGGYSNDYTWEEYCAFAHYDGSKWTKTPHIDVKGWIFDIAKGPNGTMWACGNYGNVLKLINGTWISDTVRIGSNDPKYFLIRSIEYYQNKTYLVGRYLKDNVSKYYMVSGDLDNWQILDSIDYSQSGAQTKWGHTKLYRGKSGQLYSLGSSGIWSYNDGGWSQSYNINRQMVSMYEISPNYMIAVGDFDQVVFNSGKGWESFYTKLIKDGTQVSFRDLWTNGYETFILGYFQDAGKMKSVIWHGK